MSGIIITITEDRVGQRLDNFLLWRLKNISRQKVYRMLRKGEIRVNRGRSKPDYRLQAGDIVRLPPEQAYGGSASGSSIHPTSMNNANNRAAKHGDNSKVAIVNANSGIARARQGAISTYKQKASAILKDAILYEDEQLIIINKTAGIAVHGGSGLNFGLIELLREYWQEYHQLELVHRLDRETSGCLLLSKKRSMLRLLHGMLREHKMQKTYHALVMGAVSKAQEVTLPLAKLEISVGRELVKVDRVHGSNAITRFKPLQQYEYQYNKDKLPATLIEAQPITGKTHQIRVHALAIGSPIAGDERYGDRQFNTAIKHYGLKRLFLHAVRLEFECPKTHKLIDVQAPYDKVLTRTLKSLDKK